MADDTQPLCPQPTALVARQAAFGVSSEARQGFQRVPVLAEEVGAVGDRDVRLGGVYLVRAAHRGGSTVTVAGVVYAGAGGAAVEPSA